MWQIEVYSISQQPLWAIDQDNVYKLVARKSRGPNLIAMTTRTL